MATQATKASERRQALWSGQDRNRAIDFLKGVTYVKDPRTGSCFALYKVWISGLDREFATAVPCDDIPEEMLIIPDMGTNIVTNNIAK